MSKASGSSSKKSGGGRKHGKLTVSKGKKFAGKKLDSKTSTGKLLDLPKVVKARATTDTTPQITTKNKKRKQVNKQIGVSPSILRVLEPRILLDAAALVAADAGLDHTADQTTTSEAVPEAVIASPASPNTQQDDQNNQGAAQPVVVGQDNFQDSVQDSAQTGEPTLGDSNYLNNLAELIQQSAMNIKEIVFVDMGVADYQELIDAINIDSSFDIVLIQSDQDGVEQIASELAGRQDIEAIHIISHGSAAELRLGNASLNSSSIINQYTDELQSIAASLTINADILIYGCDFGQGEQGLAATQAIADLTGADIASSIDATGNAALGGDWDLEASTGQIDNDLAFDNDMVADYQHVLADSDYKFTALGQGGLTTSISPGQVAFYDSVMSSGKHRLEFGRVSPGIWNNMEHVRIGIGSKASVITESATATYAPTVSNIFAGSFYGTDEYDVRTNTSTYASATLTSPVDWTRTANYNGWRVAAEVYIDPANANNSTFKHLLYDNSAVLRGTATFNLISLGLNTTQHSDWVFVVYFQNGSDGSVNMVPISSSIFSVPGQGVTDGYIYGNEVPTTVSVSASVANATETGSVPGQFTISLNQANTSGQNITVNYTISGTANGEDYTALSSGSVVFANNDPLTKTINVTGIVDDSLLEGNETVIMTLTSTTLGSISGNQATVNIVDNDSTTVSIVAGDNTAAEVASGAVNSGRFIVSLGKDSNNNQIINKTGADIIVNYTVAGSTAVNGTDYTTLTGNVHIPDGQSSAFIDVGVIDDSLAEQDETVIVTLTSTNSSAVAVDSNNTATVTIADNDQGLSVVAGNTAEGSTPGTFTIQLSQPNTVGQDITINYTITGTATAGATNTDYSLTSSNTPFTFANTSTLQGTAVIHSNQQSVVVNVNAVDDELLENNEMVTLTINDASYVDGSTIYVPVISGQDAATVTIADTSTAAVSIAVDVETTTEVASGNTPVNGSFTVSLKDSSGNPMVNNTGADISVPYVITGTAINGIDYTNISDSVSIPVGQSRAVIDVTPLTESAIEGNETVTISLDTEHFSSKLTAGANLTATVTIIDKDYVVSVVASSENASEAGQVPGQFAISLNKVNTTGQDITVNYTISGSAGDSDYTKIVSSSVVFASNELTKTINVANIVDDALLEGNETVILTIDSASYLSASSPATFGAVAGASIPNYATLGADGSMYSSNYTNWQQQNGFSSSLSIDRTKNVYSEFEIGFDGSSNLNTVSFLLGVIDLSAANLINDAGIGGTEFHQISSGEAIYADARFYAWPNMSVPSGLGASGTTDYQAGFGGTFSPGDRLGVGLTTDNKVYQFIFSSTGTIKAYGHFNLPPQFNDKTLNFYAALDQITSTGKIRVSPTPLAASVYNAVESVNSNDTILPSGQSWQLLGGSTTVPIVIVQNSATVTIADNDTAIASITANVSSVTESVDGTTDSGQFTISLKDSNGVAVVNNTGAEISIPYLVTGTATNGVDYTTLSGIALIPVGQSSTVINVTTTTDSTFEVNETVTITLDTANLPSNITSGGTISADVTIAEKDYGVSVVANDANAAETGTDSGQFTISLNKPNTSGQNITVNYTISGTAGGSDYTELFSGSLVFANNDPISKVINVADVVDDNLLEGDETVILTITKAFNGVSTTADIILLDAGTGSFTIDSSTLTVTNTGGWGGAAYIDSPLTNVSSGKYYYEIDLMANVGAMFVGFANKDMFTSNYNPGAPYDLNNKGFIVDTDGSRYMTNIEDGSPNPGIASGSVTGASYVGVELDLVANTAKVHWYNISGTEVALSNSIDLSVWASKSNIVPYITVVSGASIKVLKDTQVVGSHIPSGYTYAVGYPAPSVNVFSGQNTATVTIADNDPTTVSISATDATAAEVGSGGTANPGQFTVSLGKVNNSSAPILVNYTISTGGSNAVIGTNGDYTATYTSGGSPTALTTTTGTVSIASGQSSAVIDLTIIDDSGLDENETVIVTLTDVSSAVGANVTLDHSENDKNLSATVNIIDNEAYTITVAATDNEAEEGNANTGRFTISLDKVNNTGQDIPVHYTLTGTATGADYTGPTGTAVILKGQQSVIVDITATNDTTPENNETVILTLTDDFGSLPDNAYVFKSASTSFADDTQITPGESAYLDYVMGNTGKYYMEFTMHSSAASYLEGFMAGIAKKSAMIGDTASVEYAPSLASGLGFGASWYGPGGFDVALNANNTHFSPDGSTIVVTIAQTWNRSTQNYEGWVISSAVDFDTANGTYTQRVYDNAGVLRATAVIDLAAVGINKNDASDWVFAGFHRIDRNGYATVIPASQIVTARTPAGFAYAGSAPDYGATFTVSNTPATVNILPSDNIAIGVTLVDGTATENAVSDTDPGSFTINLSSANNTGGPITVNFSISGTATRGASNDYVLRNASDSNSIITGGSVDIPNGASSITVNVTDILEDALLENEESVIFTITSVTYSNGQPALLDTNTSVTLNIINADVPNATIYVTNAAANTASASASEGTASALQFTVDLGKVNKTGAAIRVNYSVSGAGTPGSDYSNVTGYIDIADGQSTGIIDLTAVDDALLESNEAVTVTLISIDNYTNAIDNANKVATVILTDNDTTQASISANDANAAEVVVGSTQNSGQFTVDLGKVNNTANSITVNYTVTGTADADSDYTVFTGSVVIAQGQQEATIDLTALDDSLLESTESVIVTLTSTDFAAATIGINNTAIVNILDNDSTVVSITADTQAAESGQMNGRFIVDLGTVNKTASAITVNYTVTGTATAGIDYTTLSGSVVVPKNERFANIDVTGIIDDQTLELGESIIVTLDSTSFSGAAVDTAHSSASIDIADDDSLFIEFSQALAAEAEADMAVLPTKLLVKGSSAINRTVFIDVLSNSVNLTENSDYTKGLLVTIPAGNYDGTLNTAIDLPVTIVDDFEAEVDEALKISLGQLAAGVLVGDANNDQVVDPNTQHTITDAQDINGLNWRLDGDNTVGEGKVAKYSITLTNRAMAPDQVVKFNVGSNLAMTDLTAGAVYNQGSGIITVTGPVMEDAIAVSFGIIMENDTIHSTKQVFTLNLTNADKGQIIGNSAKISSIIEDDPEVVPLSVNTPVFGTSNSQNNINPALNVNSNFGQIISTINTNAGLNLGVNNVSTISFNSTNINANNNALNNALQQIGNMQTKSGTKDGEQYNPEMKKNLGTSKEVKPGTKESIDLKNKISDDYTLDKTEKKAQSNKDTTDIKVEENSLKGIKEGDDLASEEEKKKTKKGEGDADAAVPGEAQPGAEQGAPDAKAKGDAAKDKGDAKDAKAGDKDDAAGEQGKDGADADAVKGDVGAQNQQPGNADKALAGNDQLAGTVDTLGANNGNGAAKGDAQYKSLSEQINQQHKD